MNKYVEMDRKYLIQCYTLDPIVFTKGDGMYLYDDTGKKYLDFSGQFSACTLGHNNKEMIEALKEQLEKIVSVTSCYVTEERAELAKKMIEISPDGLDKVMFGCTGSDANEFALKLAKYYKKGGRIVSFRRGFYGSTASSAAATGKAEFIQENSGISELLPKGFVHSAPLYCFHCDFGKKVETCCSA